MPGATVGGALLAAVGLPTVVAAAVECTVVWPGGSHSLSDNTSFKSTSHPEQPMYLSNTTHNTEFKQE